KSYGQSSRKPGGSIKSTRAHQNLTEDWGRFMHTSDTNHTKSNLSCHLLTCACRTVAHISNL
uniref:Uncharacterized protein n=1 Tax=Ursus maritimus TaxID=29073 RepID=A0A452T0R8_URSMA